MTWDNRSRMDGNAAKANKREGQDKMYISEFVCGIGITIIAEIIAIVLWAVYDRNHKK